MTKKKPVILIGAGGHAKVLLDILLDTGVPVLGFLDNDASLQKKKIFGLPVLGTDEEIARCSPEEINLVNGIGSVGVASLRKIYSTSSRRRDSVSAECSIHSQRYPPEQNWGKASK